MNGTRGKLEILALACCAFILSRALLSLILTPADSPVEGSAVWQMILAISYLSVAFVLIPYSREVIYILRRNWYLPALVLLALSSCLWAESPGLVLRRSIAVLGTTLFGVAMAVRLSLEDQLKLLSWVFRIMAVLSVVCVVVAPAYGIAESAEGEWRGIFGYKNELGSTMALSILVETQLPTHSLLERILKRLALLLSAVLLFFASSITPIVSLAGAWLFVKMYQLASRQLRTRFQALVLTASTIAAAALTFFWNIDWITSALRRSSDLTGRTEIWAWVMSFILKRPVLGYGYSGFWEGASSESAIVDRTMGTMIMYSHNGYLEILLTLGAVGLAITLAFLARGLRRAYISSEHRPSAVNLLPLTFLAFFTLHNLGECTILFQNLEWAMCVAIVVGSDYALMSDSDHSDDKLALGSGEEFA